jgi:hypothetical protein
MCLIAMAVHALKAKILCGGRNNDSQLEEKKRKELILTNHDYAESTCCFVVVVLTVDSVSHDYYSIWFNLTAV